MKIAFAGKMGSGKDEAVKFLINKVGGTRISFADPIYDILHYAQKTAGFTIQKDRKFLQTVGTDWARNIDSNVWINVLLNKSRKILGNVFISDLRFDNEFEALKKNGWLCVKLIRNTNTDERIGTGNKKHISENSIENIKEDRWDFIINNDGTLDEFYENLKILFLT